MKLLKGILISLGLAGLTTASTPQEQTDKGEWVVFPRALRDQNWVVAIDRWIESAEAENCRSWAKVHFQHEGAAATLSSDEAIAAIFDLEEAIERSIGSIGGRKVGSRTGADGRTTWFCAQNADLAAALSASVRELTFTPVSVLRSDRSEATELLPDYMESQLAGNRRILDELRQNGDSGTRPRRVTHVFVFDQHTQTDALKDDLISIGYRIDETPADDGRRNVFHVYVQSDVLLETVDRQTVLFNEICARYGCLYDGWETPVVRD